MTIFAPFSARFLCIGYGARDPQARLEKQIRKRVVGRGKQRVPPLCIEKQNQKTVVGRGLKGSPLLCAVWGTGRTYRDFTQHKRAPLGHLAARQVTNWQKPISHWALWGLLGQTETIPNHTLVRSMASCKLPESLGNSL